MNVCIVGGGSVGFHIASVLSEEGHNITIIEENPERCEFIQGKIDALVINGSGASDLILERAKISKTDSFIATTGDDAANIIACLLAKEFDVPQKIARIKTVEYGRSIERIASKTIGIDFLIKPRNVVAQEICNMVYYLNTTEVAEFAKGEVIFFSVPCIGAPNVSLDGLSVKKIRKKFYKLDFSIVAITRKDRMLVPHDEEIIELTDIISFVCKKGDFNLIQKKLGFNVEKANTVFILGAGVFGQEVARRLLEKKYTVKIIDRDPAQCAKVSDRFPDALVLNSDSMDAETLKTEGVDGADIFISATNDDQTNILGAILAKKCGAKRTITVVNDPELVNLTASLGINVCVNPKLSTASAMLRYVRGENVFSVAMLDHNNTEVIELQLPEESPILKKPLHSIEVPEGVRIGAIVRKAEIIIPSKDSELEAGDHIIVLCLVDVVAKTEKFFL